MNTTNNDIDQRLNTIIQKLDLYNIDNVDDEMHNEVFTPAIINELEKIVTDRDNDVSREMKIHVNNMNLLNLLRMKPNNKDFDDDE